MSTCVTLITGASSGIGADLARIFAANGHRVALVARRDDRLEALAAAIVAAGGAPPLVIPCDLTRPDAGEVIAATLDAAGVEIDILVNNAGFGLFGPATTLDRAKQLDMVAVNIRALTDLSLRFSDSLIRHRGGLLNVASIAAFLPGPGMAVYYATKAYVLSLSDALHNELGRHGVRVTALCPGPVPTEFQARAGFTSGVDSAILNVSAERVALAGYHGLTRGKRVVLPGFGVRAIPFMLRFVPRGFVLTMVGLIQRGR
ncbi:MAG: SDR family oxidoreductase [Xanthobacteraceae bacterium]|nr:SDR family oxidoreductase [Xanthobacteraceae bacterium]